MSTASVPAHTTIQPSATVPAAPSLLPDFATVLLCAVAFVRPLFSPESLGTQLANAALVAAAVAVVFNDFQTRRPWRPSMLLLVSLLSWIAGVLYASRTGIHPGGLEKTLELWGGFAVVTVCAHRLAGQPHRRRLLLQALIAAVVLLAVYGLEEQYLERPLRIHRFDTDPVFQGSAAADIRSLGGQERFFNPRISGAFYSSNLMGTVFMLGALATIALGWARVRRGELRQAGRQSAALVLMGLAMIFGLYLTGSKGAWAGLFSGFVVLAAAVGLQAGLAPGATEPPQLRTHPRRAAAFLAMLLSATLALPVLALFVPIDHPLELTADGRPNGGIKSALVRADYWQTGWKMWRDHPMGIGPDQIQQRFSQYRSPWALETPIDLHHEFFEFLVEGGPFALLGALGVFGWILARGLKLLRAEGAAPDDGIGSAPDAAPTPPPFLPLAGLAAAVMAGAWLVSMTSGWTDMNMAVQPVTLMDHADARFFWRKLAFLFLLLGVVGLLCVWLIRSQPSPETAGVQRRDYIARYLRAPLIAALAALLVHSGFDFVLQSGAVLVLAGILAGLITAADAVAVSESASSTGASTPALPFKKRFSIAAPGFAVLACALLLGYLTVYKPIRIDVVRNTALQLHQEFAPFPSMLPPAQADDTTKERYRAQLKQVGDELIAARVAVLDLAPDDNRAVLDLHEDLANYLRLAHACGLPTPTLVWLDGRPRPGPEVLEELAEFHVAMNPYDGARWFYAGRLYLSLGDTQDLPHLEKALDAFRHAAALDPQRPMLQLMIGDCLLAKGDRHDAAQAYAAAWQAQWNTSIPDIQFYCLYYDPNQEILPPQETGMDQALVEKPTLILHEIESTTPEDHVALLRRYWVALRAIQLTANPLPAPVDPSHPTQQETLAQAVRTDWTRREKQTLDDILKLRPGSVDTMLLQELREIAGQPEGTFTDKQLVEKFAGMKALYANSTVDRPLPGTVERIEESVVHPPRQRYSPETYYAVGLPGDPGN
ncbi:MAG TPA: O-antigen ligase family protein [Planctomycetota bacterium]|nr:O-antigen ligase family protein [Planctomycetota bacterium]